MKWPWEEDPLSPAYREWDERRTEYWNSMWDCFRPADGVHREPVFYIDIPTIILAGLVGFPLGGALADALTGQPGLGGIVGFFVMMLVFGYFRRRLEIRGERGESEAVASPTVPRSPARTLAVSTAIGAVAMALLGVWFAFNEGDIDPVTAGVRFAAVGAVPGFIIGLIAAWRRRRASKMARTAD